MRSKLFTAQSEQRELYPVGVSHRAPPANLLAADASLFAHELTRAIPATTVRELEAVTVDSAGILVMDGRILPDSLLPHDSLLATRGRRLRWRAMRLVARQVEEPRPCIWLVDQWSNGYFHWLLDALPRAYAVRDQLADSVVLLPYPYRGNAFVEASLRVLGAHTIRYVESGQVIRPRRLLIPSHTAPTGNYNEAIVRGLRMACTSYFGCDAPPDPGERTYISRSIAHRRKLANESEIRPVLERFAFSTERFEELPWADQVRKASGTAYLVSLHGSGLTNMLFMRSGTSVLEVRRSFDRHNNCYFSLAAALGIRYFYLCAEALDQSVDAQSGDLLLCPSKLEQALSSMLKS